MAVVCDIAEKEADDECHQDIADRLGAAFPNIILGTTPDKLMEDLEDFLQF